MKLNRNTGRIFAALIVGLCMLLYKAGILGDGGNRGGNYGNETAFDPDNALASLQSHKIKYTKHAYCRMDCRYIDKKEIDYILKNGKINKRKSKPNDSPCPTYAVEGRTKDNQNVRIVFAGCDRETKVVTAIDLDTDHKCDCY